MGSESATFNLADLWEIVVDEVADREALVCGDRRLTFGQIEQRANQLAHAMAELGVEPGQHIGLYLRNGTEYIEAMLAAYKLRAVPINVNYRYVSDELEHLFDDSDLVGLIHHRSFAPQLDGLAPRLNRIGWYLWVDDDSDEPVDGISRANYEEALSAQSAERAFSPRSGDDPYVIYTGGTTGLPKGVVWRQEDAFFACVGGGDPMRLMGHIETPSQIVERIIDGTFVYLPVAPLMHAAGQWTVLSWLYAGGKIVLLPGSLDPGLIWRTAEDEGVNMITVVGDAVLRPLIDEWDVAGGYNVPSLITIASGGAPLTPSIKARLNEILPNIVVADGFGSSETGAQGAERIEAGAASAPTTRFTSYGDTTSVLDEVTHQVVEPGSGAVGRLALRGRIPQGYYNDPERTASTFVTANGHRWVLTGDMATVEEDGKIQLLGRGSGVINTGGEKVFAEEVEATLKEHPDVYDALVVGVDDERWGQRVTGVVQVVPGTAPSGDDLAAHCRTRIAGYKVPRGWVFVDEIVRSPAGKADYRWALSVANAGKSASGKDDD